MKAEKLASGNWRAKAYVGRDISGKQVFESFTAPTKKEAEYLAAAFLAGKKQKAKAGMTLTEAMEEFIATCKAQGYSPSTVREYTARKKNSFPKLASMRVDKITARDVQLQMDERSADHSAKTVRNDFYFLKRVMLKYSPDLRLDTVILSRKKSKPRRTFQQDLPVLILNCARENFEPEFYLYCAFALSTGMRPSEISALTWGDVSAEPITAIGKDKKVYQFGEVSVHSAMVRDENSVFVEKSTKTAAGVRTIRVDWSFFENLYSLKPRGADDQRIICMNTRQCSDRWGRLREKLGLSDDLRFYDLRHYFATSYANSGANEEELQRVMGHTTASFTHAVYVELFADREANINEAMAKQTAEMFDKITNNR